MEQTITCINCPVGCRMTVTIEDGKVTNVTGNVCPRGKKYAEQECIAPERMVTAVVPVAGSILPVSCKPRTPNPKDKNHACMAELADVQLVKPVLAGSVICPNVCGTGVDVIATRTVD